LKENLVFNYNRLLVGLILLIVTFCSYIYKFDIFFFSIISFFIILDVYYSKLLKKYFFILALLFFITSCFLIKINSEFLIYFNFFIVISFILSLNKNLYFIFFPLSILFFNVCFLYLLLNDRNIFYIIILISFINDTSAYLFGNLLKGPLIAPKVSPKKTWSGTLTSFLISFLLLIYLDFNIFLSFILSISLFLGDLYFSQIKRRLKIKDFSNFLGSHGGILDRLDSMFIFTIIICSYKLYT
tara:strand:+ start:240 stop:965 length:726 start_codon:yes stop_codon:yes gene_type:complete